MQTYTYVSKGKFELKEKPKPLLMHERDAIVKVTLASICSSDLHIKHGSVPRAVPGITIGHEMVGVVEAVGNAVTHVKPGDRVTVNVETFCGECFFCKKGYVNNCTDENGGWALGCRIDGGQAEYVRVPFADQGLNKIPDEVTDRQALLVGDVLATGYWATRISEITEEDTVLIIGAGPTGICTLLCVMLKKPKRIIMCEKDKERIQEVIEPSNIAGVKIENDGTSTKIENSQLDLSTILDNYNYLGDNCLDLYSFIEDYKKDENAQFEEKDTETVMKANNKTLHIDQKTHNPTQMEIKDNKQKTTIYILYNEVKVNSTK